jgi:hypothetical protein
MSFNKNQSSILGHSDSDQDTISQQSEDTMFQESQDKFYLDLNKIEQLNSKIKGQILKFESMSSDERKKLRGDVDTNALNS